MVRASLTACIVVVLAAHAVIGLVALRASSTPPGRPAAATPRFVDLVMIAPRAESAGGDSVAPAPVPAASVLASTTPARAGESAGTPRAAVALEAAASAPAKSSAASAATAALSGSAAVASASPASSQVFHPTPEGDGFASIVFHAPNEIDYPVRPRSAPDTAIIQDLPWSGLPIRLRLFIDAQGRVVAVTVLSSFDDPGVVERVRRMLMATAFVPARLGGEDVASYKDIELTVGTPR